MQSLSTAHHVDQAARDAAEWLAANGRSFLKSFDHEAFPEWAESRFMKLPRYTPGAQRPALVVVEHLGEVPSFLSSTEQARAVHGLLQRYPFEARDGAAIVYTWHEEFRLVAVDLVDDFILRFSLHDYTPRSGFVEVWPGHALYRLNAAAKGGSYAETPHGRTSAVETRFTRHF
ncbi:hypothetical protein DPQ33_18940 [Oceanidesulfovibrio indonesiensis]|uniref:Uncharacterized protein n=1 Tax=Oceanidesulfovibrio indonesiensis TaxID=54767 RepID=A0A7M3MA17_9BACT|nr:hypothetical protein [Oceanidesulfovibrio indonesiensis]TVM10400.1 hypothetical protein DPQ33_18940 [Oceanidesulfovibrio indonesiensis]